MNNNIHLSTNSCTSCAPARRPRRAAGSIAPAAVFCFCLACLAMGAALPRQDKAGAANPAPSPDSPPKKPASAQEVLDAMLRAGSTGQIIRPVQLRPSGDPRAPMPEGSILVDRTGRLTRRDGVPYFVLEGDASARPIRLLPNRMLEAMVRQVDETQRDSAFVISGQLTEYFGENYLLVTFAAQRADAQDISK